MVTEVAMTAARQLNLFSDGDDWEDETSSTFPAPEPQKEQAGDAKNFGVHLLALGKVPGIGINTLKALIDHYKDISHVWEDEETSVTEILKKGRLRNAQFVAQTLKAQQTELINKARKTLAELNIQDIKILPASSPDFPKQLVGVDDAPYWLFVQGQIEALKQPLIGIVGTREPSKRGVRAAASLAEVISSEGFGIVSGLAEGIDNAAHKMGLHYSIPQVAVLGTGIDVDFPASTRNTRARLLRAGGAIITEYLPGESYNKGQFVERNRIQALLSVALAPVESKRQSGTAHTVRFAEKYGRSIFGVKYGGTAHQNELIEVLQERKYPIFDLSSANETTRFLTWLKEVVEPSKWPTQRFTLNTQSFFQPILKQFEDMLDYIPLNEEKADWLLQELEKRVRAQVVEAEESDSGG
jgi:DNA protecting protein DprA